MQFKIIFRITLFSVLCTISTLATAAIKPLDHIVVIVNDDVITNTMLNNRVVDFRQQLQLSQLSRIDPESLKKQVLERMIRDTIQLQQAKQFGITVDDLMLNRMLEQIAKTNNLSLDDFRSTIEGEGINYARFREQTRDEIIIKQLQQRVVASKISVSDQEVRQYIEQSESLDASAVNYHLRHILISTPEAASAEDISKAENKARDIYNRILDGEQFEDLAIKESNGRNALNGGDLGDRKASELPQLFIDAIRGLHAGETSTPVKSASGFHLLQVISSSDDQLMIEQTHARHILIRTSSEISDNDAKQLLSELKRKIENGEKFAVVASEFSEDPGSKIKGGDLGWSGPGDFVPAFENVVADMEIGKISEPFKSKFGWHILEVLERRDHNKTQANKENLARDAIQKRKIDEELRLWLRRIRDEAYVEFIED